MDDDLVIALQQTRVAMNQPPRPLFEATFQYEGVLVRADLLLPDETGWRMVEVKSSTSVKGYHLNDAAVQTWVLRQLEIPLGKVELAHINNQFVYPGGGDYQGLFHYADITEQVLALQADVPMWIANARVTAGLDAEPTIQPGAQCTNPFECSFRHYCDPSAFEPIPPHSVRILPYGGNLVEKLLSDGKEDLRELSEDIFSNSRHQRIWRTIQQGRAELAPEAGETIRQLDWPRYYIDFETLNPAIPLWAGTRPYQQVPFQWSCHIETKDNLKHTAFLADGLDDPRRSFIESLLDTVGNEGPVIVYNASFESCRLQECAEAFPDLAERIESVIDRIFDLLPLSHDHYYHPDMLGSWSIKAVLPTIAPELSYEGMTVAHGGAAQDAFAEIMMPETNEERRSELRQALLDYCERDTLAMVRIADFFAHHGQPVGGTLC
ncbi:DUF2779 domain-containing protein [Acidithiobacillus sp. YTS05]|nr:DUF2779 domain-containing protein [Acidithiobacillus sp. YTS05]